MVFPPLDKVSDIKEKINLITRNELDGASLQFPNNLSFLKDFEYYLIRRKTKPFSEESNRLIDDVSESLMVGLYASQSPFCYVIDAYADHIEIYFGSKDNTSSGNPVYKAVFEGYWGTNCLFKSDAIKNTIKELEHHSVCGSITGIPNTLTTRQWDKKIVPSDNWLRSLQGQRWTFIVCGYSISRQILTEFQDQVISEIATLKTHLIREDIVYQEKRLAEHYQSMLETYLKRFEQGRVTGIWQIGIYFFAKEESLIRQGLGMISAHLGGRKTVIQPIRVHLCYKNDKLKSSIINLLTSIESASLITIPDEETPGYTVQKVAYFDSDNYNSKLHNPISIGNIIVKETISNNKCSLDLSDLTRHGLISGVTGSGKTTTCFYLLKQLKLKNIPFLIIESAKSEYRQLLNDPAFKDMLVFTLGDETPESAAPFRINPFEVPDGILVQSHLDYLKALFRASFVMYAPMPYVLEEALHEIYRDKGWNLSANHNKRGKNADSFPTITDLYEKIGDVVARLGYDERISKDILAGLKTRINNLRLGGKGAMLDTTQSLPIPDIMKRPVLLELKKIGNDDEKAFLIGIILTKIYEYYESTGGNKRDGLCHLTLIEEAHRLLKHVPEVTESDGNVRSKAVETFCNMLAEIRAYGEGVIVSEQIPEKLARDLIKNTNLKIMHRIVARDDRDIMGDTMNLSDEQKQYVTTLDKGKAIVYAEGMDTPFLVSVPIDEMINLSDINKNINDKYIFQHMDKNFYNAHKHLLLKYKGCNVCGIEKQGCDQTREIIKMILETRKQKMVFNRLFFAVTMNNINSAVLEDAYRLIKENFSVNDKDYMKKICMCYLVQATQLTLESQGRMYSYPFKELNELNLMFVSIMQSLIFEDKAEDSVTSKFQEKIYSLRCRGEIPFIGCCYCNRVCIYRYETSYLLGEQTINNEFEYIVSNISDDYVLWMEIARLCLDTALQIVSNCEDELMHQVALCYLSQKIAQKEYAPRIQEKIMRTIRFIYEKGVIRTKV